MLLLEVLRQGELVTRDKRAELAEPVFAGRKSEEMFVDYSCLLLSVNTSSQHSSDASNNHQSL